MVDNLSVMGVCTDVEFSRHLGVELKWTKFVMDILKSKGVSSISASFEDMVTDIVTNILMAFEKGGKLKDKAEWYRQTCIDEELVKKQKKMMAHAVMYRFRDFRRRPANKTIASIPDKFEVMTNEMVGAQMDADDLSQMITDELANRRQNQYGVRQGGYLDLAVQILPDRIKGLSMREICAKHSLCKGQTVSNAIQAIYATVETVANKLGEGWMLTFLK